MTTLKWKKSTRSNGGGNCVEVARPSQVVLVRDSKDREGAMLSFDADRWVDFVQGMKAGEFNA
ncbi:DUF397 domain-containing protein [Micromonospora sp. WMMD1120]|uniref:DUF397 domain-containing protein n=1 Tax=Micromonospora sp. WMMD1120 TaxID=3016106 RepID=UPI00241725FE|nr:DUF397 domain-containing protein [Micromonospora sp. WMMD1120]MDG4809492.1 DUF397 domain-containing protein [Micromonospora sp. WMMD1120]